MNSENGHDLRSWLGFAETPKFWKSTALGAIVGVLLVLLVGCLFGLAVLAAFKLLGSALFGAGPKGTASSFGLSGVIVAMIGAPLVVWRTSIAQEQTKTTKEALFNDKVNAAVSDLHAQRQITKWDEDETPTGWEDDVTRRNGAIDRLLGLAKEEPESAPRIARMLSVYVKELSREYPAKSPPEMDDMDALEEWANNLTFARSDMQNAVQVLGKLREESGLPLDGGEIDLSETNLQGFDLKSLNFERVSFLNAQLQGADLSHAQLQGTILQFTKLQGANLRVAKLQGANLRFAKLQGADLKYAQLQGADLIFAHLRRANLSDAQMQRANLGGAQLQRANLRDAQLQGADLREAQFETKTTLSAARFSYAALGETDFSETTITHEQLSEAFGDASVILPDGKGPSDPEWPKHWSKEELGFFDFVLQWHTFQEANGFDPDNPN